MATTYTFVWEEDIPPNFKTGLPTSVVSYSNHNVNKLNEGDPLAKGTSSLTDIWKYLETWGGTLMWEGMDAAQTTKRDLTWLVEGMESNTLVWVTDGLYDQKRLADLSGVGWIIFCSKTGLRMTGTFWERSPAASKYWAEMLGLCALHLFVRAFLEFHKIQEWKATLCCDNKRLLELSSYPLLKGTKHTFTGKITYVHVYGHMDRYLLWHLLSLPPQLNCVCDTLAKHAMMLAMTEGSLNRPT